MCFNAGKTDRIIRVVAGIALIAVGFVTGNVIVSAIGLIPLITGIVGFCPFYPLFKINTGCKKED